MPRIFDNIDQRLLSALVETLGVSDQEELDFIVNYDIKYRMGRANAATWRRTMAGVSGAGAS